jgi:hypothetical protein
MRILHIASVTLVGFVLTSITAQAETALEHLQAEPRPVFKQGHTLPPLSRWGWSLPVETSVELCEHWGYALEFGSYATMAAAENAHDAQSRQGKVCALTAENPQRYPLFVITHRPIGSKDFQDRIPESFWLHNAAGKRLDGPAWKCRNPEASDELFQRVAEATVAPLKKIREKCPIAIVLDGGENGLTELGHSRPYLQKDPSVVKAKGDLDWWDYYSRQKARSLLPTTEAIRKALPDRQVYLWYHFGGMPNWTAPEWSWSYEHMRPVADMPGQSLYYQQFNSGWTGDSDLLTFFLCSYAQAKEYGDALSYNWVCAGWNETEFSGLDRYMGFLKCLYTAGQIGAVAGYFSYPKPGFDADLGPEKPHWLEQMIILGRAHALFSHVDDFIREGDLLAGPDMHELVKQRTGKDLPAYEFPTGDPDVRVLARKHRQRNQWLVTAWAAAGEARDVEVFIDEVGEITLNARPAGSVYHVTAEVKVKFEPPIVKLELLDKNAMRPSMGFE